MNTKNKEKVETITEQKNQSKLEEECAVVECVENKLSDVHKESKKSYEKVAGGNIGG
ncbi:hypothetical protein ACFL27_16205 [candidate division CSSED10-310 bacterium]|uniref:Bacteriocin n=1 Tax=candidate division CSSED10-310 bacterium TaxID=2855610 RepID=A0ABV6YZW8_UNCC1